MPDENQEPAVEIVMEGRWTIWLDKAGKPQGIRGCFLVGDEPASAVEVVPCDDAAIRRAARGLARAFGEEAGFVDWLRVAETALRAAGETP